MGAFLFTAFILGLDSFVVAVALSPLIRSPASRCRLASLFGICDGLAVVAGSALGAAGLGLHIGAGAVPCFAIVFGVYCLIAAQWQRFRVHPRLVWLLPPLMSLDNLAFGAGAGSLSAGTIAQAVALGAASLILAALGLFLGSLVRFASERASQFAAGAALLAAGLILSLA